MDSVFIQVDVYFQGIFTKYPIRYTGGITQRFLDIDFAGMDTNECYEFIEQFTGEKCEKLYYCKLDIHFPKDHFGNSNMQEWLEEHKEEVVDNIVEEVIDGAGLIKEIETDHLDEYEDENEDEDEDEDDHGAEDVDVDEDEDNHSNPHFFKRDNGPDVDMGENAALGDPLEEAMHWQVVSCGGMKFETRKMDELYIVDVTKKE
ncbi:unnamed protein product [Lactuca virosa]|uniref:Uncharacterized protein n=1 Tax=Lactuca virosa TaxID=75947 RepID=A0AAU9PFH6_9ASTR|nr:unnamed protein product [Lactuca virosa]